MKTEEFLLYCKKWHEFWSTVLIGIILIVCLYVIPAIIYDNKKFDEMLKICLSEQEKTPECKLLLHKAERNKVSVYVVISDDNKTVKIDGDKVDEVLKMLKKGN